SHPPRALPMSWHPSREGDELVFAVCEKLIEEIRERNAEDDRIRHVVEAVAGWLALERGRPDLGRLRVLPLVWEGSRRGFLFLEPPDHDNLPATLAREHHLDREQVRVVAVRDPRDENLPEA